MKIKDKDMMFNITAVVGYCRQAEQAEYTN